MRREMFPRKQTYSTVFKTNHVAIAHDPTKPIVLLTVIIIHLVTTIFTHIYFLYIENLQYSVKDPSNDKNTAKICIFCIY